MCLDCGTNVDLRTTNKGGNVNIDDRFLLSFD